MPRLLSLLLCLALAACAVPRSPPPAPVMPAIPKVAGKAKGGGVYRPAAGMSLFADKRALRVGDALTVVLEEATQASKKAGTSLAKGSSMSAKPSILFGNTINETGVGLESKNNFGGNASSTQQNALTGAITVIVQDVLPNGLLLVEGQKKLNLNQDDEFITLKGYVREADIETDNRVSSQRIANASIAYTGSGALNDSNAAGWLTRLFNSPWMPF